MLFAKWTYCSFSAGPGLCGLCLKKLPAASENVANEQTKKKKKKKCCETKKQNSKLKDA